MDDAHHPFTLYGLTTTCSTHTHTHLLMRYKECRFIPRGHVDNYVMILPTIDAK